MASYPSSLWAPSTKTDNVDDILASHMNDAQAEIVAIETLLGTSPGANRIPTGNAASPLTWEANLIFDGNILFVGDTANANMTAGLTLNQGAADNEILALKSSDVAHGVTGLTETDTYALFTKAAGASGGLRIDAVLDAGTIALHLNGWSVTDDTAKTTAATGNIVLDATKISGVGGTDPGANANLVVIRQGSTPATRFIFDAEGSAHADVEWVAFDGYDDIALLDALNRPARDIIRNGFGAFMEENRAILQREKIVNFYDPSGARAMVNFTRLAMLHTGAIGQIAQRLGSLERRVFNADN